MSQISKNSGITQADASDPSLFMIESNDVSGTYITLNKLSTLAVILSGNEETRPTL